MADDELRVRQLAYRIWESEGRPEGQQQRHWDMALKIVSAERASGHEAHVEEAGEAHEEAPILEDELPLEDDERGIEENRLPLEDPGALDPDDLASGADPSRDEVPYRDDVLITEEVPVQDRAEPTEAPLERTFEVDDAASEPDVEVRRVPKRRATTQDATQKAKASKPSTRKSTTRSRKKETDSEAGKTTGASSSTRTPKTPKSRKS